MQWQHRLLLSRRQTQQPLLPLSARPRLPPHRWAFCYRNAAGILWLCCAVILWLLLRYSLWLQTSCAAKHDKERLAKLLLCLAACMIDYLLYPFLGRWQKNVAWSLHVVDQDVELILIICWSLITLNVVILQAAGAVKSTGAQPDSSLPALPPTIGGISVAAAPGQWFSILGSWCWFAGRSLCNVCSTNFDSSVVTHCPVCGCGELCSVNSLWIGCILLHNGQCEGRILTYLGCAFYHSMVHANFAESTWVGYSPSWDVKKYPSSVLCNLPRCFTRCFAMWTEVSQFATSQSAYNCRCSTICRPDCWW